MNDDTNEIHKLEVKILEVEQTVLIKVSALEIATNNMHATIQQLVRKEQFQPVAWISYGLAAGVLSTALGAVISQVFIKWLETISSIW